MKDGKSGPEKYYFLLPYNRNIQVGAQYTIACAK